MNANLLGVAKKALISHRRCPLSLIFSLHICRSAKILSYAKFARFEQ